jgi:hypothetical protein
VELIDEIDFLMEFMKEAAMFFWLGFFSLFRLLV